MLCRSCGTEIADKAIVCFRCGEPTASPRQRAMGGARPGRPAVLRALAAIVLLVAMGAVLVPRVPAGTARLAAFAGLALITFLVVRFLIRPRPR